MSLITTTQSNPSIEQGKCLTEITDLERWFLSQIRDRGITSSEYSYGDTQLGSLSWTSYMIANYSDHPWLVFTLECNLMTSVALRKARIPYRVNTYCIGIPSLIIDIPAVKLGLEEFKTAIIETIDLYVRTSRLGETGKLPKKIAI